MRFVVYIIYEFDLSNSVPFSIPVCCVSARRLDVYEEQSEAVGCSVTLRSRCSRKSLSCRSLSCNQSSVSLNTLTAESDEEEQLPNPRTSAFSSRVVRHCLSLSLSLSIRLFSFLFGDFCLMLCPGITVFSGL